MQDGNEAAAFSGLIDLSSEVLGGQTLLCSDEFFAPMDNLLKAGRGVFIVDKYTDRGKWMDGWEPRRRRSPGHDWCIIRLGVAGTLEGVDIDTNHFLGNHPPFGSLDAVFAPDGTPESLRDEAAWTRVLDQVPLKKGSQNLFSLAGGNKTYTHVRLNIYPAGGVARLRVYGRPVIQHTGDEVDLACLNQGAMALACSDMFFSPMNNLLLPQRAKNMGQGWETRRSRPPGLDWIIIRLAQCGRLRSLDIDTHHFKGNYPDRVAVDALCWPDAPPHRLTRWEDWTEIVPETKMTADSIHSVPVEHEGPWTHLRMRVVPDGGVSRLRVWGTACEAKPENDALLEHLNGLSTTEAEACFLRCCGSPRWAQRMATARPFVSRTHLFGEAEEIWWHLGDGDWLEAFTHHPQIGADVEALRAKFSSTANWSEGEQAGVATADDSVLVALAQANQEYIDTYGYIFIVCASGKSATEMLHILESRQGNEPAFELRVAAGEQAKITRIRLEKLEDEG